MNAPLTIEESSKINGPQIKGYRTLSAKELALINMCKEQGQMMEQLVLSVRQHLDEQFHTTDACPVAEDANLDWDGTMPARTSEQEAELARINQAEPQRWASIARTHFQEGLMALVRAVAQPSSF